MQKVVDGHLKDHGVFRSRFRRKKQKLLKAVFVYEELGISRWQLKDKDQLLNLSLTWCKFFLSQFGRRQNR